MGPLLPALLIATMVMTGDDATGPRVSCAVPDDTAAREYVLDRTGRSWRLSFRSRETRDWIRLLLPGAEPVIERERARLTYRNANGGRQIDLDAGPGGASLDVWVDYGLDVNIEPDLDPRVDLMNTEGPLTRVTCVVDAQP